MAAIREKLHHPYMQLQTASVLSHAQGTSAISKQLMTDAAQSFQCIH